MYSICVLMQKLLRFVSFDTRNKHRYSLNIIIRSVLIMENPYVVYKITEFCIILWMNFRRKRIVISTSIRCCLHGVRDAPASRTACVCAVWYMKKTSVYRSYVSSWPVKNVAELTDGPTLEMAGYLFCLARQSATSDSLLAFCVETFINQKLTSRV
jgi:transposase